MGQAKARGTFEQRKENAIATANAWRNEFYNSSHKPTSLKQTNRGLSPLQTTMLLMGALPPIVRNNKGQKGGSCNRESCQLPPATWYNHSTGAYYCEDCAILLNLHNADWAIPKFGHDLCTEEL